MNDRAFYIASAVAAVLIIVFSLVWPQGEGQPSPAPFGHAVTAPDYDRMVRDRSERQAREAQQKAAQIKSDAALHAEASSVSSSYAAARGAK